MAAARRPVSLRAAAAATPLPPHAPLHTGLQRSGAAFTSALRIAGTPCAAPASEGRAAAAVVAVDFRHQLFLLNTNAGGGWTLGYWMAAQGAVLVFIAIVVAYAKGMSYFERRDTAASHD